MNNYTFPNCYCILEIHKDIELLNGDVIMTCFYMGFIDYTTYALLNKRELVLMNLIV
jgi:hypothetical protein